MSNETDVFDQRTDLSVVREPEAVLAEAQKAAAALKEVISKKAKPVIFNGEQYLEFEDWQTVGKFYGVTVKVLETRPVQFGDVMGFEARAVVIHGPTGREISAAEAMCLNDEEKWSKRTKYEYQNGKKVAVGEVAVPLFQLRSMAQTRACAKALRNVLAWVVVLAGYKPTPAEEMTGHEGKSEPDQKPVQQPKATSPPAPEQAGKENIDINARLQKKIAKLCELGAGTPETILAEFSSFESTKDGEKGKVISAKSIDNLCKSPKWAEATVGRMVEAINVLEEGLTAAEK